MFADLVGRPLRQVIACGEDPDRAIRVVPKDIRSELCHHRTFAARDRLALASTGREMASPMTSAMSGGLLLR